MSGFVTSTNQGSVNNLSETTATPNSIPRSLDSGLLDPSWTAIDEVVSVAKSGARFTSVNDALDSITDASITKPYSLRVYPGVYYEDPIVMKPYVSIRGFGSALDTVLRANDMNSHFITASGACFIQFLGIHGPTAANKACIYNADPIYSAPFFVNDCIINDGYVGILDDASAAGVSIQANNIVTNSASTTIKKFLCVSNYGNMSAFNCQCFSSVAPGVNRGICISGPNAQIKVYSFNFEGLAESTGVYIDNGSTVRVNNSTFLAGETAFHICVGGSPKVAIGSTSISATDTEYFTDYNIIVDNPLATVSFYGKADKQKISVVTGASFTASYLDVYQNPDDPQSQPGNVISGELWLGTNANAIPMRQYSIDTFYTGWTSGGEITRHSGLVVRIESGNGYVNTGTGVREVMWDDGYLTVPRDYASWISVDSDGYVDFSTFDPELDDVICLAAIQTSTTAVEFISDHRVSLEHQAAQFYEYVEHVIGSTVYSGCAATKNGDPLKIDVDGGTFYIAKEERIAEAHLPIRFTYWYKNGYGKWKFKTDQTVVDTGYYDDGTGTLATVPVGAKHKRDLLLLSTTDSTTDYHIVYGQELFDDEASAISGVNPILPEILTLYGLKVAGVVCLGGAATIAALVDQRPQIGTFATGSTVITRHGDLSGLGGGNDHPQYQLRTEQGVANGYPDLDASALVPADQLNIAIYPPEDITKSAALVGNSEALARQNHKHDISTAAASTLTASTTNAEGSATSLARSDHLHTISTGSPGTISIGDSANAGASANLAKADHTHAVTAPAAPATVTKSAANAGAASTFARSDHKHDISTDTPVAVGAILAEGSSTSLARADHVHKGTLLQTSYAEITVDTTVAVATGWADLLSVTLTTRAGSVLVHFTACGDNTNNAKISSYRLDIDGVVVKGVAEGVSPNIPGAVAIIHKATVTAASHTIKVQWSASANTSRIRPVTNPNTDHASLLVQEVSV